MARFSKLLLAIDLSPESDLLINRVAEMCQDDIAKLNVVHVIKQGLHDTTLTASDICRNAHAQRVIDHTSIMLRPL